MASLARGWQESIREVEMLNRYIGRYYRLVVREREIAVTKFLKYKLTQSQGYARAPVLRPHSAATARSVIPTPPYKTGSIVPTDALHPFAAIELPILT